MKDTPPSLHTIRGQDLPGILHGSITRHCLPCRGIIGEGDEPQRTPGTLYAPPNVGYGSNPGGGETPPNTLSQVLHNRHMESSQRQVPGHCDVIQGRGEELEETEEGRGTEEHIGELSGLWENFGGGVRSEITWEDSHIIILQLTKSGCKHK